MLCFGPRAAAEEPAQPEPPETHPLGELRILDPWVKGRIGVRDAKLFFSFQNLGDEADRLIAVSSPAAQGGAVFQLVLPKGEDHSLAQLEAIPIPPTETPFELSEAGYYVELRQLDVSMVAGQTIPVKLRFEKAGEIEIPISNRFHPPALSRRIAEAIEKGDLEALRALRDEQAEAAEAPE